MALITKSGHLTDSQVHTANLLISGIFSPNAMGYWHRAPMRAGGDLTIGTGRGVGVIISAKGEVQ